MHTGVGCHFLLQCMKMKSESEATQSCPTLSDPWTAAYQAPALLGFSRQEYWSGVPLPSLHDVCGSPLILEGAPVFTGPRQAPESMTWAFLHHLPPSSSLCLKNHIQSPLKLSIVPSMTQGGWPRSLFIKKNSVQAYLVGSGFGSGFIQRCVQAPLFFLNYFYFLYWKTRVVLYKI